MPIWQEHLLALARMVGGADTLYPPIDSGVAC